MSLGRRKPGTSIINLFLTDFNSKMGIFRSITWPVPWVNSCQLLHHPYVLLSKIKRRWNTVSKMLADSEGVLKHVLCFFLQLRTVLLKKTPESVSLLQVRLYPTLLSLAPCFCSVSVYYFQATHLSQCQLKGRNESVLKCFVKIVPLQPRQYF